jgi:hypothetical protein
MPQLERAKEIANRQDLSTSNGTSFIKKLNFLELRDDEIEERVKNEGFHWVNLLIKLKILLPQLKS